MTASESVDSHLTTSILTWTIINVQFLSWNFVATISWRHSTLPPTAALHASTSEQHWKVCFLQEWPFGKLQNTLCVWKVEKGHFCQHKICFGKIVLFWLLLWRKKTENTTKKGFQQTQGKTPKSPFWGEKGCFLEGVSKRLFTICDPQKLCSAENTNFIVFSAKHSFCREKGVRCKK